MKVTFWRAFYGEDGIEDLIDISDIKDLIIENDIKRIELELITIDTKTYFTIHEQS